MIDIEPPQENREQQIGKQDKLLITTFQFEIKNRKVEGLITYSTDQQIFKFKVKSGTDQEVWGVYIEFSHQIKTEMDNPWYFTTYGFLS